MYWRNLESANYRSLGNIPPCTSRSWKCHVHKSVFLILTLSPAWLLWPHRIFTSHCLGAIVYNGSRFLSTAAFFVGWTKSNMFLNLHGLLVFLIQYQTLSYVSISLPFQHLLFCSSSLFTPNSVHLAWSCRVMILPLSHYPWFTTLSRKKGRFFQKVKLISRALIWCFAIAAEWGVKLHHLSDELYIPVSLYRATAVQFLHLLDVTGGEKNTSRDEAALRFHTICTSRSIIIYTWTLGAEPQRRGHQSLFAPMALIINRTRPSWNRQQLLFNLFLHLLLALFPACWLNARWFVWLWCYINVESFSER